MSGDPISLQSAIKQALEDFGLDKKVLKARVSAEWKEIVGGYLSENLLIENFDSDVLVLRTDVSTIRNEIMMRKKEMMEKINNHVKQKIVNEIILR